MHERVKRVQAPSRRCGRTACTGASGAAGTLSPMSVLCMHSSRSSPATITTDLSELPVLCCGDTCWESKHRQSSAHPCMHALHGVHAAAQTHPAACAQHGWPRHVPWLCLVHSIFLLLTLTHRRRAVPQPANGIRRQVRVYEAELRGRKLEALLVALRRAPSPACPAVPPSLQKYFSP